MGRLFFSGDFISIPKINGEVSTSGQELFPGDIITFESGFLFEGPTRYSVKYNSTTSYNGSQKEPIFVDVSEDVQLEGISNITTLSVTEDTIYTQVINIAGGSRDENASKLGSGDVLKAGSTKYLTRINYGNDTYLLKDSEVRAMIPDTVSYDNTNGLTVGVGTAQSPKVFIKTINGNALTSTSAGNLNLTSLTDGTNVISMPNKGGTIALLSDIGSGGTPFTNSVAGIILGSTTDGYVASADSSGHGVVSGWSTLVGRVEDLEEALDGLAAMLDVLNGEVI